MVWALATLGYYDDAFMEAFAPAAVEKLEDFNAQVRVLCMD